MNFAASDKKETEGEESCLMVLAPDLINIMEASILTFHLFLKMDKKKSIGALNLFGNQNQTATPLHQIQSLLEKVNISSGSFTKDITTLSHILQILFYRQRSIKKIKEWKSCLLIAFAFLSRRKG